MAVSSGPRADVIMFGTKLTGVFVSTAVIVPSVPPTSTSKLRVTVSAAPDGEKTPFTEAMPALIPATPAVVHPAGQSQAGE